ncbi:HAMP domain-containing sensor histidine kinase [Sporomusa sp.]|uniref:sensor histidine kinase n=1 Tax=Sporomusa sp. TaxID=2078658 RepID=UPI002C99926D|nr:HAMP domain-containing sensor histidine kinase [Sporomusa sp.]HWR44847.1 HAMP domain-containing sensor histidine kinase [Sporomusa sp.]
MRSLLARVTVTVFATTFIVVVGLMFVVNYQVSENFSSYLYMSGMHGMMMNHGSMKAMMGTPERQFITSLRHSLVLTSVIMLAIGAIVSYYLARSIAVPVINLNKAINNVTAGNLNTAVAIERQDEVGQLAEAFNEMTAKLKSNTILRQRFLAGVAHELRTPLTILKANLEGIADGIISPDQEQINSLTEEVDRLTKMVGELRDLSLLEAGQMVPEYGDVDLNTTLSQVIQKIKPLAYEKNLELILKVDDHVSHLWADNAMLQQMAYNLIINAIRYTSEGSITVKAGWDKQDVYIDVIDTGIGIAPADIKHIFDYFYRVDQARTKQSGGTGLGLALVKQMVTAHGGQVFVTSKLGHGSTFTLRLPLNTHKRCIISP